MWHGQSVYGEMVHVPLVVRWPAGVTPATVVDEPVQLIDVMPTLLDISGWRIPRASRGRASLPLLHRGVERCDALEAAAGDHGEAAAGRAEIPAAREAYAIIDGSGS